jgi:hypothetical protein
MIQGTIFNSKFAWIFVARKALLLLAVLASFIVARFGKSWSQWLSGIRARNWPTVSASVDVVSVAQQIDETNRGDRILGYLATLTYFYRNPDLQTGDYCRVFDNKEEGERWAASFKGRTVLVHVDPRDPSRSALRAEEL